jgi:hypothetical protein
MQLKDVFLRGSANSINQLLLRNRCANYFGNPSMTSKIYRATGIKQRFARLPKKIAHYAKFGRWRYYPPPSLDSNPTTSTGNIVFFPLGETGFDGPGKMIPDQFLPPFCAQLQKNGLSVHLPETVRHIDRLLKKANFLRYQSVLIFIYNEAYQYNYSDYIKEIESKYDLVFNSPSRNEYITDKRKTNRLLKSAGISVPRLILEPQTKFTVFSNAPSASGAPVWLLEAGEKIDQNRYNTEFIDTRIEFEGKIFFTTVRIFCVGREIVHAWVRARNTDEHNPSVHAKNTPLMPSLIEYLQQKLVTDLYKDLEQEAQKLSDCLGLGFWVHDLLIDSSNNKIYVCETGYKFQDWAYVNHLKAINKKILSHRIMFTGEVHIKAANLFLKECQRFGVF